MKISNNALNFLLAQYRAIFKRAYVKGLASAVLLTAGLAAGAAQAAPDTDGILEVTDFAGTSGEATSTVEINTDSELNLSELVDLGWSTGYINTLNVNGADIKLTGSKGTAVAINTLNLTNGASLSLTNTNNTDAYLVGWSNGYIENVGGATLDQSKLILSNTSYNLNTASFTNGSELTVGGLISARKATADENAGASGPVPDWTYYSHIYANKFDQASPGNVTVSDSTVNVGDEGMIGADGTIAISGKSTINFDGSLHTLGKYDNAGKNEQIPGDAYATAFLRGTASTNGTVTISASRDDDQKIIATPELNVLAGRNGAIYANTINLNEANVTIGSGGKFILDGDWVGKTLKEEGTHSSGTVTLKDVKFTNNGTLVLGNSQSGGRVNVTGKTDMQGDLDNYDEIYVGANGAGAQGHLIISEDQIVQKRDESGALIHDGVWTGKNVGVFLNAAEGHEAVLELVGTDADGLNLNTDVQFVSQAEVRASGDDFYADQINVTGTARIKGEHIVLTKALDLRDNAQLTVEGDILELGANDYSGATLKGLDIAGAAAHDDISLNASGDVFEVDGDIDLSRDFYTKDTSGDYTTTSNGFGTIRGDSLKVVSGSTIEIKGGAWRNEDQGLTISSGTLTVGADATNAKLITNGGSDGIDDPWNYVKNGNPASLTWHGAFNISGGDTDKAKVNVTGASGADSTLDLREANVSWGSGTVTLGGSMTSDNDPYHVSATDHGARAGQGILHITGSQLSDFLDLDNSDESTTATILNLQTGGVLLVDGTVTGTINFSKFTAETTTSAASSVGTINFDSHPDIGDAGWMIANGELTLVTGVDTDGENGVDTDEIDPLNIGNGTLFAEGLTLNNLNPALDEPDADVSEDVVQVTGGTIGVAQRLSSTNNEIHFEDATLLLDSKFGANKDYGFSASSNGGVVNVNQLRFTSGAGLEVGTGDWTIAGTNGLGDLYFDDSSLEVGFGDDEYQRYGYTASLTADNLSYNDPDDGSVPGIDIHVQSNGALTLNTIQAPNAELTVAGTMTLNGRTDFTAENLTSEPGSLQDLGVSGANTQAGIDLTGATINVNGGKFILEDTAANALVKFNVTAGTTTDAVQVNAALADANIHLEQGAEFKLNFSSGSAAAITTSNGSGSVGLLAEQAKQLKSELEGLRPG